MMAIWHVVGIGSIHHQAVNTLAHWPVDFQTCLVTREDTVVIILMLFLSEEMVPYAHLTEVATESLVIPDTSGATHRECV